MTVSLSENANGVQPQNIFPLYVMLARPVFDIAVAGVCNLYVIYSFVSMFLQIAVVVLILLQILFVYMCALM